MFVLVCHQFHHGRAHRRHPVAQLYGHGAVAGVRSVAERIGSSQFLVAVGHFGKHVKSDRLDNVQTHSGKGPTARLRVPNIRAVAQHLVVAQADLVHSFHRNVDRGNRRQRDRHMDSSR